MPDLHTEMQKILHAWEQPEPTEQPKETTVFTPTNNVTKSTFNFIRDNSGCNRNDAIRLLVQQGHKKSSVSSLIGQMLRQGHIYKDSDGLLRPNGKEYTPIKSAKTMAKREAKVKKAKTFKLKTSAPEARGIDALEVVRKLDLRPEYERVLDNISLSDAHELYRKLHQYFGGLPK